jgi:hypothetical protein
MKKFLLLLCTAAISTLAIAKDDPTEKIIQRFTQTFQDAHNVTWDEVADKMFEVKFTHRNIASRAVYDQKGNIVRLIRYYEKDQLPVLISSKLDRKYEGKKVFGVTEVTVNDEIIYQIVLEDAKNWTYLRSDIYGNMELEKKFRKA